MRDLFLLVEGQTEEAFVKSVLGPHLEAKGIAAIPIIVETSRDPVTGAKRRGGGRWKHWAKDLRRVVASQRRPDVRFTTFFDLYGLPEDFPGLDAHGADRDTIRRATKLEQSMAEAVDDHRFIPYIQRHEFEALVLASLDALDGLLDEAHRPGIAALRENLGAASPEDVNDGEETAPSKRLLRFIAGYRKPLHGVYACEGKGLAAIRAACPRFNAWVTRLEAASEG